MLAILKVETKIIFQFQRVSGADILKEPAMDSLPSADGRVDKPFLSCIWVYNSYGNCAHSYWDPCLG